MSVTRIASGGIGEPDRRPAREFGRDGRNDGTNWAQITTKPRTPPLATATNLPSDVATASPANPDYPTLFTRAFGDGTITASRIAFAIATYERR